MTSSIAYITYEMDRIRQAVSGLESEMLGFYMTGPAIHFEAKKHAFRMTQDGVVVSFVIHPNDMNADFAVAPLGTRYMVAVAKIGDDGNPIPPGATTGAAIGSAAADHPPPPERSAIAPGGARKSWYEQPASQRAGILCNDPEFWRWTGSPEAVPYVEISRHPRSADEAASWFRTEMDIASRAHLDPSHSCFDPMALKHFQKMERAYRTSRGWETEEIGR